MRSTPSQALPDPAEPLAAWKPLVIRSPVRSCASSLPLCLLLVLCPAWPPRTEDKSRVYALFIPQFRQTRTRSAEPAPGYPCEGTTTTVWVTVSRVGSLDGGRRDVDDDGGVPRDRHGKQAAPAPGSLLRGGAAYWSRRWVPGLPEPTGRERGGGPRPVEDMGLGDRFGRAARAGLEVAQTRRRDLSPRRPPPMP